MNITCGKLIRNLRKKLNMNQEAFAEKISVSVRQLSRMETDQANVSILDFMDMMQVFNVPIEDLNLLYLESDEYRWYKIYCEARSYVGQRNWERFHDTVEKLKESPLFDNPYLQQIIAMVKFYETEESRRSLYTKFEEDDVTALHEILSITIEDFDEEKVSEYMLAEYEFGILGMLCNVLSGVGKHERAINLAKSLINNKTTREKEAFPGNYNAYFRTVLVNSYLLAGMHNEALDAAVNVLRYCINNNLFASIDMINSQIADIYELFGEENSLCITYFLRAYHWAIYKQDARNVALAKQEAKEKFNLDLEDL